jgi:hypothetical protein
MTADHIAIIGAISTILAGFGGAVLGSVITYRTSNNLIRRQEFNNAATQFKKTFFNTVNFLETGADRGDKNITTSNVYDFLSTRQFDHIEAIYNLKSFLSKSENIAFEKTWKEYRYGNNEKAYEQYSIIQLEQGVEVARKCALEKLNKILNFAKFK